MSALHDKINSYSIQYGIEFDQAYTLNPTFTGTNAPTTTPFFTLSNAAPTYEAGVGPTGGAGSWRINMTSGALSTYFRTATASVASVWSDGDFSTGIWLKFNTLPTGSTITNIHIVLPSSSAPGFTLAIRGSGQGSNPSKLQSNFFTGASAGFGPTIEVGKWYYIAHRKSTTANTAEIYVNGTLAISGSNTTTGSNNSFGFGLSGAAPATLSFNFSNFYMTTYSAIGATQIAEIYNAGIPPAVDININETPATASAMQTEPTLAVSAGDHTEVTTSIPVDAEFPSNITVSASANINFVDGIMEATATIGDNIQAGTENSTSFDAAEMTATAEMMEPVVSEAPMTAVATMSEASLYVDPSYYAMVKSINPLVYFEFDNTTNALVNKGSITIQNTSIGVDIDRSNASGGSMGLVGAGNSWKTTDNTSAAEHVITFQGPTPGSGFNYWSNLELSRNLSYEFWYKAVGTTTRYALLRFGTSGYRVSLANNSQVQAFVNRLNDPIYSAGGEIIGYATDKTLTASSGIKNQDWNHVVFTVQQGESNSNIFRLYVNGSLQVQNTFVIAGTSSATADFTISFDDRSDIYIDQAAIYDFALSGSQVLDHYSFIAALDPNAVIVATPLTASATSGNHSFVVTSDAYPEVSAIPVSVEIIMPTIIAGTSITTTAEAITASANIIQPTIQYDTSFAAEDMIAYSESVEGFALNSIYSDYVLTNIQPYRYVTFDAANEFLDYGSDNDYAVDPVVVGGTIVSPQFGINGKSALTAGNSYVTDGVILKESEWDDNWGTGLNRYHSSFWIKKSEDDNSTGLRVIWNLNGYLDNQHVVLYQYQGKLHMQFNNGSGSYIEQTTVNNVDLFDGQRHFVVVDFDHTGANGTVRLYVDAVLVMTVSLGTYNGTTVNYSSSVPANDEQHNHPRLSVGCLITPFASTALPVVPTNTKIYVDEIVWAKTAIDQNGVSALYSEMPDQSNEIIMALSATANATMVNPSVSTTVNFIHTVSTADSAMIDCEVFAVFSINVSAEPMTANSDMGDALRSEEIVITTDTAIASAIFNDAGVKITIPGPTMYMRIEIVSTPTTYGGGIIVNGKQVAEVFSPLVRYIRSDIANTIIPMSEVN